MLSVDAMHSSAGDIFKDSFEVMAHRWTEYGIAPYLMRVLGETNGRHYGKLSLRQINVFNEPRNLRFAKLFSDDDPVAFVVYKSLDYNGCGASEGNDFKCRSKLCDMSHASVLWLPHERNGRILLGTKYVVEADLEASPVRKVPMPELGKEYMLTQYRLTSRPPLCLGDEPNSIFDEGTKQVQTPEKLLATMKDPLLTLQAGLTDHQKDVFGAMTLVLEACL